MIKHVYIIQIIHKIYILNIIWFDFAIKIIVVCNVFKTYFLVFIFAYRKIVLSPFFNKFRSKTNILHKYIKLRNLLWLELLKDIISYFIRYTKYLCIYF